MRFRPANIRLINRRPNLPRLLLALSSIDDKSNDNNKNNPTDSQVLTGSLHIRSHSLFIGDGRQIIDTRVGSNLDCFNQIAVQNSRNNLSRTAHKCVGKIVIGTDAPFA